MAAYDHESFRQTEKRKGFAPPAGGRHLLADIEAEREWASTQLAQANVHLSKLTIDCNREIFDARTGKPGAFLNILRDKEEAQVHVMALMEVHRRLERKMEMYKLLFSYANIFTMDKVLANNLRRMLAPPEAMADHGKEIRDVAHSLARALHDYCENGPSDQADASIRAAVSHLKIHLKDLGPNLPL